MADLRTEVTKTVLEYLVAPAIAGAGAGFGTARLAGVSTTKALAYAVPIGGVLGGLLGWVAYKERHPSP